ncbi:MAG: hypothetical protein H0V51_00440 [Chloroflexi bacterium]|nr:hypothetical protein [Chloroflexota bacterium]
MNKLTRRTFLRSSAAAIGAGFALHAAPGHAFAQVELPWTAIGYTQAGAPIVVYHLGDSASRILLLGGQHGGPEANTIQLVRQLTSHFTAYLDELPRGLGIDFLPDANPDGTRAGIRQYLSGVDPNRNWPSPDWRSDAYDSNGVLRRGLGGAEPFSDQETRAMAAWLLESRPLLVVNYHSAGGFMFGGRDGLAGELAEAYAGASGYWRPVPGGGSSPLPYRATGSMNVWMREVGIDGLFVELTTPSDPELRRNLAGLRAVLTRLA